MSLTPDTDHGAFMSFLDWMDEFSQVPKNVLRGNFGAAGRHALNIAGDAIDSVLPGDLIPDARNEGDNVSTSELIGLDEKEHPWLGLGANLVGDTLLNPLSYVGLGELSTGANAGKAALKAGLPFVKGALEVPGSAVAIQGVKDVAKAGFEALPKGVQDFGAEKARQVRSVFGAEKLTPETRAIVDTANAAKSAEADAGVSALKGSNALMSLTPEEDKIVGDVMDNWKWNGADARAPAGTLGEPYEDPFRLLAKHPGVTPENSQRLTEAITDAMNIGQQQEKRANIFTKPKAPDPLIFGATTEPQTAFHGDYLGKTYSGQTENQAIDELLGRANGKLGNPSSIAERSLEDPAAAADFLGNNPGVKYERSAVQRLANRASQQGTLASRAEIGKAIYGAGYQHADDAMRSNVVESIEAMAKTQPEDARVLMDMFKGVAPRGKFMSLLAKTNRVFKPAAVYGYAIPKIGSDVRNALSGVWQAFSNPESRGAAMGQLKLLDSTIIGSIADAMGFTYPRDKMKAVLTALNDAHAASGGLSENALGILKRAGDPASLKAASLIENGVLDGFQSVEGMGAELARSPMGKKLKNIGDWPGKIFRGVEDRMRAGMYLDLEGKVGAKEAARITGDSLYRYPVNSIGNRRARDIIPFFQFSAKAIPQQAKLFAEKPAIPVALGALANSQEDDQPIYPYMEGKLNVPLGPDANGGENYASGFGLPFEALNQIPSSFRDIKRNVIGSSQPLLKTAFGALSGEDPYFETPFGEYDKMPVFGHQGGVGKAYNALAGTGLIQPLDSPLHAIDQLLDSRRSPGVKALDLLTGAKVTNVDPDVALQQQLQEALKTNPDVHAYKGFYADAKDAPTQALIRDYGRAKQKVKKKRQAEQAQKQVTKY